MTHIELTPAQRKGLLKLGDVVIPGDHDLPSFSESGCAAALDRMLPYMYEADRSSFLMLIGMCAKLPKPAIAAIVASGAGHDKAPGPAAGVLRMANIGIKGVIMSLYYSNLGTGQVWPAIGYRVSMTMRDPEPNAYQPTRPPANASTDAATSRTDAAPAIPAPAPDPTAAPAPDPVTTPASPAQENRS